MAIIMLGSEAEILVKMYINMHVSYVMYLTIFSSSDLSLRLGLFLWICIASDSFLLVVCCCISSMDTSRDGLQL